MAILPGFKNVNFPSDGFACMHSILVYENKEKGVKKKKRGNVF